MAIDKEKFPIVLTIIENFGLSSSWTGNAVASANPVNFYSLWKKNPHTALFPSSKNHTSSYENNDIDLERLFSGRDLLCDKEYLDQIINENQLKDNKALATLLDESFAHNTAVHLIGNFPGSDDKHSDLKQLLSLIEIIKEKNIVRLYLHLIVDDNVGHDLIIINNFLTKIKQSEICEIASVIGSSYLEDYESNARNFTKAINTMVSGEGERALSAEQALSFRGVAHASEKKPTSVLFNNRYAYKINNFDSIILFNHNNQSLSKLAIALATSRGISGHAKLPKFLNIVSMFEFLDQGIDQLRSLFQRDSSETLAQSLYSANIDQLYLSDTTKSFTIDKHLKGQIVGSGGSVKELFVPVIQGSNPVLYDQVLELMLKQVSYYLEKNKSRFITFLIPILASPNITSFAQTVAIIKLIDKFLPKLEAEVLKHNGVFILTSDHGGTEKMSERNNFETINSKTCNPVPLILSIPGYRGSQDSKTGTVPNRMLYDMMKKSHFISDLAPTILDLFHVEAPEVMTGKSFLSELRVEVDED